MAGKMISEQRQSWAVLCSAWEPLYPSKVIVDAEAWGSKDCFLVIYISITATQALGVRAYIALIDWSQKVFMQQSRAYDHGAETPSPHPSGFSLIIKFMVYGVSELEVQLPFLVQQRIQHSSSKIPRQAACSVQSRCQPETHF